MDILEEGIEVDWAYSERAMRQRLSHLEGERVLFLTAGFEAVNAVVAEAVIAVKAQRYRNNRTVVDLSRIVEVTSTSRHPPSIFYRLFLFLSTL